MRCSEAAGGTCGNPVSVDDQVWRRSAKTAVAVVVTPSPWLAVIDQCCVDRLVRTGAASILNSPSASGPA